MCTYGSLAAPSPAFVRAEQTLALGDPIEPIEFDEPDVATARPRSAAVVAGPWNVTRARGSYRPARAAAAGLAR